MSSRLHQDKSREELIPLVDNFIQNYKKLFGVEPDQHLIFSKLEHFRKEKETQMFISLLEDLSPKNLAELQELFKTSLKETKIKKKAK